MKYKIVKQREQKYPGADQLGHYGLMLLRLLQENPRQLKKIPKDELIDTVMKAEDLYNDQMESLLRTNPEMNVSEAREILWPEITAIFGLNRG